ncbi:MAG: hypothetical protein J6U59_07875 [Alistipes sp.]|nr:hypothetical protein [Alistipes sp.]
MTLNETMNEIADAIREKKGTTEKIAPINFAEEIKSISAGGGESASTIEYLDVSGIDETSAINLGSMSVFIKYKFNNDKTTYIAPPSLFGSSQAQDKRVVAITIALSEKIIYSNQEGTLGEFLSMMGIDVDIIPRLTKEQFYDLNA